MRILVMSICGLMQEQMHFTQHTTAQLLRQLPSLTKPMRMHRKAIWSITFRQQVSSSVCTSRLHLKAPFDQLLSPSFDVRSSFLVSKRGRD